MLPFSVREREGNEWAAMYQGAGGFFGFFFSWVNLNDQQKGNKLQSLDSQLEIWFGWVHHQKPKSGFLQELRRARYRALPRIIRIMLCFTLCV
jgi:hypothetical protein